MFKLFVIHVRKCSKFYEFFNDFSLIHSAQIAPLVQHHCRLNQPVFPVTSIHSQIKYSHGKFLHSKLSFRFLVFTHHQQTFASSSQRTETISDEMIYSFSLFARNHRKLSNLFVISLSEIKNLTLYFFHTSLIKREALKTAGPEIHR